MCVQYATPHTNEGNDALHKKTYWENNNVTKDVILQIYRAMSVGIKCWYAEDDRENN